MLLKNELKTGDVVSLRNKKIGVVLLNTEHYNDCILTDEQRIDLINYEYLDNNLIKNRESPNLDILSIEEIKGIGDLINLINFNYLQTKSNSHGKNRKNN
ncbi:MAG: hypothetical protein RBT49_04310 [Bacteroidales bacterium]|jgi:hypothetical protein|nr:hypothetical protein [Bacteroidales bacterium]